MRKAYTYENVQIGNFILALGYYLRDINKSLYGTMNLLQQLSKIAQEPAVVDSLNGLVSELEGALKKTRAIEEKIEKEIAEYQDYHQALQATEKWLLQMSFQLMAHNALYITNKEQTIDQLEKHEELMNGIRNYQSVLDNVREQGHSYVAKYMHVRPDVKPAIEKQHQNFQESYNSLLQTGTQIKNRLVDSLNKFQEYEDALENIIKNLDILEPEIRQETSKPLDNIADIQSELDTIRVSKLSF
jgi:nesprin-1